MKNFTLMVMFMVLLRPCMAIPPTVTNFSPATATTGMTVTITGTNFTNTNSVTFGGTAATSFIVVSPTQITAVVSSGSSGSVEVTNPDGSGNLSGFVYEATCITSISSDEVCESGELRLSATASSGTIDWYDAPGGGSPVFSGDNFTTPLLSVSKTYYVVVSGCATSLRVPVTATVHPQTNGGNLSGSTTVVTGSNTTTLVLAGYAGKIIKWQSSTDGFNSEIHDINHTLDQLTVSNLTITTSYRVVLQSGICDPDISESAKIAVSGTLPIHISSIRGAREQNKIRVRWTAYAESNTLRYELEKSADGQHFYPIYSATSTGVQTGDITYNGIDDSPAQGYNFYRVKEVMVSGNAVYSAAIKILYDNNKTGLSIFPNPVVDRQATIQFNNVAQGIFTIRAINNAGQVVFETKEIHPGGYFSKQIQLPDQVTRGVYTIQISGEAILHRQTILIL